MMTISAQFFKDVKAYESGIYQIIMNFDEDLWVNDTIYMMTFKADKIIIIVNYNFFDNIQENGKKISNLINSLTEYYKEYDIKRVIMVIVKNQRNKIYSQNYYYDGIKY